MKAFPDFPLHQPLTPSVGAAGAGNGSASAAAGVEKDAEDGGPNAEMKDPPAKSEPQTSCGEKDESSEGAAAEEDAAKCAAMETD